MSFLLLLWVCVSGALLARRLDPGSRITDTLALGAALGLAVFAGLGFLLGWTMGLSKAAVFGAAILTSAIGVGLGDRKAPLLPTRTRPSAAVILLTLLAATLVARLADRTLFTTPLGVATGDRHNFGDLPFHMGIAAGFAYGNNFPPDHPELAGTPLTYPFFGDLISGMILVAGGTWKDAFFWPNLILGLSVVVALTRFGESMTGSRALGRVGTALTIFSGGLGFLALTDSSRVAGWWTAGPDLTINDTELRYANFVLTLFIPQRSILFGWPLLFFALALVVGSLRSEGNEADREARWLRAGLIGSFLPLAHSHSFAVLGFCVLVAALRAGWRPTLAFLRGVVPLALPAILFMASRNSLSTGSFFAWQPGFDGGAANPLKYWLMNAGLFLPLVLAGMWCARAASVRASLAAPFLALFVGANLFRLSPWMWDNMKFLAPAHAGLAPFAAIALAWSWRRGRLGQAAALASFIVATLSGALDVSKVALAGGEFGIFVNDDFTFAEKVRANTSPTDTILTAFTHNHPVLLSGRREFLGYEGHLWSQGLDFGARKPVAEAMFRGAPQPMTPAGFIRIDAIAITPAERALIGDTSPLQALPSIVDSPYRLVRVR